MGRARSRREGESTDLEAWSTGHEAENVSDDRYLTVYNHCSRTEASGRNLSSPSQCFDYL